VSRCYTSGMPTTRPRYSVTETEELAAALADAARRWPEDRDSPGRLLHRLLREGHRAICRAHERELAARRAGVEASAGALTGAYPDGYLRELRDDWPE
jgi:hypothetical protein